MCHVVIQDYDLRAFGAGLYHVIINHYASANSTQCSRHSRGSRACGAPDYLAALGAHIVIESLEL